MEVKARYERSKVLEKSPDSCSFTFDLLKSYFLDAETADELKYRL